MEANYKLSLPEDFITVCDIFSVKPEEIIQKFINGVSFPIFYSHIHDKGKWATLIFLDNLDIEGAAHEKDMEFNIVYLDKLADLLQKLKVKQPESVEKDARQLMREWHKAVGKKRAQDLLDNLPNPE